jgi:uncharacterized protein (TIGR02996 family)
MTSNDGDILRRNIVANPEDDLARLVYADWLEENDQATRAAFIRVQVEAAREERCEPFGPAARRLSTTARKLLDGNKGAWTSLGQRVLRWEFRRGFVEHVEVNVASFPRDAAEMLTAEPIRSLQMTRFISAARTISLLPFFETRHLNRITHLDLTGLHLSPVELDPLLNCPELDNLTDLCLRDLPVLPEWMESLLFGASLPRLAGLNLADLSHLGPCLAGALPLCPHRTFKRLDLSRIAFTSAELQRVLGSRCLRQLEELRLGWLTGSGREGAVSHLDLSWGLIPWTELRLLDLYGQGVGNEGIVQIVQALARRSEPNRLRWLGLAYNKLGAEAVRTLVRSDAAKIRLHHLDLRGNDLSLAQIDALHLRFPEAVILTRDV